MEPDKLECVSGVSAFHMSNSPSSCCDDPSPHVVNRSPDTPFARRLTFPPLESIAPQKIKRGYRDMSSTLSCGVMFESDPVWLWSLRPNSWSTIYMTRSDESILRLKHPALFNLIIDKVESIPSNFYGDRQMISPDIMFVSGTATFLSCLSLPSDGVSLLWMSHASRRCPQNFLSASWTRLSHCKVGGVTEARGTFGIRSPEPNIVMEPDLRRSLGHILKHSIRPRPFDPDSSVEHYQPTDLLSLSFPRRPIAYPTYMSRSGWGIRQLTDEELALCFELPMFVEWNDRFLRDIVPIQMFRSVIDVVVSRIHPQIPEVKRSHRSITANPIIVDPPDATWLEAVGKWMPGSWSDAVISHKAVKSDAAPIDLKTWRRRIQLLFPCSDDTIEILERFAAHCWRRLLCRSFIKFVKSRHRQGLWLIAPASSKRCAVAESSGLPSKRIKLLDDGPTEPSIRGVAGKNDPESSLGVAGKNDPVSSLLVTDLRKGLAVVGQSLRSTWWEWTSGSSPYFWRWNGPEQISAARDGMQIFILSPMSRSRKTVSLPRFDDDTRPIVASKIQSMISKSYLEVGVVRSHLHYFAVPKGDSDVRVVFDGTSCGLNQTLWSPNFFLPTSRNAAELLSFDSWMADADFAEFFHNFFADSAIRSFAGVNTTVLSPFIVHSAPGPFPRLKFEGLRWSRLFMGMKPSPYNAVRFYYWAEEFSKGDLHDTSNPFGFDSLRLNLPGMVTYDTLLPKVVKWNSKRATQGGDVITFVDDVRIVGSSKEHCRSVHRQFMSRMQYLGIQDAPRKYRPPSQDQAGAWTGTIFKVTKESITKSVSLEKWEKGKEIINNLLKLISDHPFERPVLNRKELGRHTGFLNHLTMTFDDMTPFLKGFYLSLNSWRSKRDDHDWKIPDKMWMTCLVAQLENGAISRSEFDNAVSGQNENDCPVTVTASTRLSDDVRALSSLFSPPNPPDVNLRSREIVSVIYGFGDASGTGLGATFTCGPGFTYRIGVWGADDSSQSSNWREFTNIVESLEEESRLGNLTKSEVFMFTDNSTVEACSIKGSSTSPKLLALIIRLRSLSTTYGTRIHIFHVAGTRMIAQGTDGVSRGYLGEGIMAGKPMEAFIPIHFSASDRSASLGEWIKSWTSSALIHLEARDWFDTAHDIDGWDRGWDTFKRPHLCEGRSYLWTPPPFAADVAIAELRKARIKRQSSSHVFVVPKLCAPLWMKQVFKAADLVFELPVGHPAWEIDMHEPLLIALFFPYIRVKPWQLRGTPRMYQMGSELRRVFKKEDVDQRDLVLCKFWLQCHRLGSMPEKNVVRKLLYFGKRS